MHRKSKKKVTIEAETDLQLKKMIGGRIKRIRNRSNKSGRTIAESIGISRSSLTHFETGKNSISAIQLWKIAGVLHCGISEFFPEVPDSSSFVENDAAEIAKESERAAEFMKKVYKIK